MVGSDPAIPSPKRSIAAGIAKVSREQQTRQFATVSTALYRWVRDILLAAPGRQEVGERLGSPDGPGFLAF